MSNKPKDWQKDPNSVKTSRVQFWRHGVMVTAQIPLENARESVANGKAFVISEQAIGALTESGEYDS